MRKLIGSVHRRRVGWGRRSMHREEVNWENQCREGKICSFVVKQSCFHFIFGLSCYIVMKNTCTEEKLE